MEGHTAQSGKPGTQSPKAPSRGPCRRSDDGPGRGPLRPGGEGGCGDDPRPFRGQAHYVQSATVLLLRSIRGRGKAVGYVLLFADAVE